MSRQRRRGPRGCRRARERRRRKPPPQPLRIGRIRLEKRRPLHGLAPVRMRDRRPRARRAAAAARRRSRGAPAAGGPRMAGQPILDAIRVALREGIHVRPLSGRHGHVDLHTFRPKELLGVGNRDPIERAHEARASKHCPCRLACLTAGRSEVRMSDGHKHVTSILHLSFYHPKRCSWQVGPPDQLMARFEELSGRLPQKYAPNSRLGKRAAVFRTDFGPDGIGLNGHALVNLQQFPGLEELRQPSAAERAHVPAQQVARGDRDGRTTVSRARTTVADGRGGAATSTGPAVSRPPPGRLRRSGLRLPGSCLAAQRRSVVRRAVAPGRARLAVAARVARALALSGRSGRDALALAFSGRRGRRWRGLRMAGWRTKRNERRWNGPLIQVGVLGVGRRRPRRRRPRGVVRILGTNPDPRD